jgi:hypothetical protein
MTGKERKYKAEYLGGKTRTRARAHSASQKIKINNEYSTLLPKMSAEEYESLKQSIKLEGLWFPLTVNKDCVLLDGHHRYKACQELGIEKSEIATTTKEFENELDEKLFVIYCNIERRHINVHQRVEIALKVKRFLEEAAKRNTTANLPGQPSVKNVTLGRVDEQIGKLAGGVSHVTVRKVENILESGNEEIIAKARAGKLSVHEADKQIRKLKSLSSNQETVVDEVSNGQADDKIHHVENAPTEMPQEEREKLPEVVACRQIANDYNKIADSLRDFPIYEDRTSLRPRMTNALKAKHDILEFFHNKKHRYSPYQWTKMLHEKDQKTAAIAAKHSGVDLPNSNEERKVTKEWIKANTNDIVNKFRFELMYHYDEEWCLCEHFQDFVAQWRAKRGADVGSKLKQEEQEDRIKKVNERKQKEAKTRLTKRKDYLTALQKSHITSDHT